MGELNDVTRSFLRDWLEGEMSDISEDHWAAGWMADTEYELWDGVCGLPAAFDWGMGEVPAERLQKLKECSEQLGEWFDGDNFIPINKWLWIVEFHKKGKQLKCQ